MVLSQSNQVNRVMPNNINEELIADISKVLVKMMMVCDRSHDEIMHLLKESFHEHDSLISKVMDKKCCKVALKDQVKAIEAKYTLEERTAAIAWLWQEGTKTGDISFLEDMFIDRLSFLIALPTPHLDLAKIH